MTDCSQTADSHFVSLSVGLQPFSKHPNSKIQTVIGLKMTASLIFCSLSEAYVHLCGPSWLLYLTAFEKKNLLHIKGVKGDLQVWKVLDSLFIYFI